MKWADSLRQNHLPSVRAPKPWGPIPTPPPGWTWQNLMAEALSEAHAAITAQEVPVGAVVVDDKGRLISRAHNETNKLCDPTAHAEILALRRAATCLGNYRLAGCVLLVTLEPCLMCAGAIREARLSGLVWGAADSRAGAIVSCLDGLYYGLDGAAPWHYGGMEAKACAAVLKTFFLSRR